MLMVVRQKRIEDASDDAIERAIGDAFDIEKQISQNWNLFLFTNLRFGICQEKLSKSKNAMRKILAPGLSKL